MSLPGRLLAILTRHGIPGSRLEIEITERAVLADLDVARAIVWELAAAGVRISLDDFGTGMSSLAILTQLPIDSLKIDRSFIAGVDRLPHKGKIVVGVLALAESLGLQVTAEGIERDEELHFLTERNCALGQGYLLGRPQPAERIAALLGEEAARAQKAERRRATL
jgi:EAL domain-containing protein (putative c-di-GMP-specific phosphodiesterase class I)